MIFQTLIIDIKIQKYFELNLKNININFSKKIW